MQKLLLDEPITEDVYLAETGEDEMIVSKYNGINYALIKENNGWILRKSNGQGSCGFHGTRLECLQRSKNLGHEFFLVD